MQLYADFAVGSNGYMAVYRSDTARSPNHTLTRWMPMAIF
jgi:hypothetical protein